MLALTLQFGSADAAIAKWPAIGRAAAGLAALAMFAVAELLFDTTRPRDTTAIAAAIEAIAPHPVIAAITADLSIGFPLTGMVHGRWAQRTPSLLIAASVRRRKPDLDPATLAFIEQLATNPEVGHLLLMGAYRDNEVGSDHVLLRTVAAIRQAGTPVEEIGTSVSP